MATAAATIEAEPLDTGQDMGDESQSGADRDYEAEAIEHGWKPPSEFAGDKARFVDAKTFVERAETVLPLIKKQNKEFKGKIEFLERQLKKVMRSEQASYENALADIKAKMESAVVTGDIAAFNALDKKADDIRRDMADDTPGTDRQAEALKAFGAWRDDHEWYDLGNLGSATDMEKKQRAYADRMMDDNIALTKTMDPADFFAHIAELVEAKYPAQKPARGKGVEAVAGVTRTGAGKSAKTGANLPSEAKEAVRRYMRQGIYKGTFEEACNAFAKDYDWEN